MKRYIFHSLEAGPKAIARLLRVFPTDRIDERLEANRFTAREVIAHLADIEEVHLGRLRSATNCDGYVAEKLDVDARITEHNYNSKNIYHEAEVFESRREMTLDFLRELTDEQLHRTFKAPSGEDVDLLTYAMSMVSHDMYHLEQLTQYLANEAAVAH
jgi:hypothetical protein